MAKKKTSKANPFIPAIMNEYEKAWVSNLLIGGWILVECAERAKQLLPEQGDELLVMFATRIGELYDDKQGYEEAFATANATMRDLHEDYSAWLYEKGKRQVAAGNRLVEKRVLRPKA